MRVFHPHFAREEKEAQRGYVACLEHVWLVAVTEFECVTHAIAYCFPVC